MIALALSVPELLWLVPCENRVTVRGLRASQSLTQREVGGGEPGAGGGRGQIRCRGRGGSQRVR